MKILGLGHSHIVAIAQGCYALQHDSAAVAGRPLSSHFVYLYEPSISPTLIGDKPPRAFHPELLALIDREAPDLCLLSAGGNEHISLSMPQPGERFDFILGENQDLPLMAGATILPEAAIRETLRSHMAEMLEIIAAAARQIAAPLYCLEPPPPLPDAKVLAHPGEFLKNAADHERLSPELLRYKMWRVASGLYREACARAGCAFVEAPQAFIAPPGVLSEAAWGADATHANASFGRAMIGKILAEAVTPQAAAEMEAP